MQTLYCLSHKGSPKISGEVVIEMLRMRSGTLVFFLKKNLSPWTPKGMLQFFIQHENNYMKKKKTNTSEICLSHSVHLTLFSAC